MILFAIFTLHIDCWVEFYLVVIVPHRGEAVLPAPFGGAVDRMQVKVVENQQNRSFLCPPVLSGKWNAAEMPLVNNRDYLKSRKMV